MNKLTLLIIAIIVCLPAILPLFRPQFFHTHDWTHVARLVEMDEALHDGHFPVRWSKNLGYGYGLPQFNFYAPLAYYVAEIFNLIGFSFIWSIKMVIIFNYVISFLVMYSLGEKLFNRYAGLVAATAFIYIPYRAVDTYVRGALAELTAITFLALTLTLVVSWYKNRSWRFAGLSAVALAGIFLSHNLTGLIAFPFVLVTIVTLCWLQKPARRIFWLQGAVIVALGIGLAAFYIVPMYFEKQFTMADTLTGGFSDYHHHFLYLRQFFISKWGYGGSIFGVEDDMSFNIGSLQVGLSLVTLLMLVTWRKHLSRLQKGFLGLSFTVIAAAMLLATFKTQAIWEAIHFMKYIQFPWRYLTIIMPFISLLAGAAIYWLKDSSIRWQILTTVTLGIGLLVINLAYFRPVAYLDNNESLYYTNSPRIAKEMSGIIPDFISRYSAEKPSIPPAFRFELANPNLGSLEILDDRTHKFKLKAVVSQATDLKVHILDFPGWVIKVDGEERQYKVDPKWPEITIPLTPTVNEIIIEGIFEETPVRLAADWISLLSLVVAGCLIGFNPAIKTRKAGI